MFKKQDLRSFCFGRAECVIECETYSAIGITTGTRLHMLVLVSGQDWLEASEYREPGWRQSVDSGLECTAELGVMSM